MAPAGQIISWRLSGRWLVATLTGYFVGAGVAIVLSAMFAGIASLLGLFHPGGRPI
jgi:hypothetical protein